MICNSNVPAGCIVVNQTQTLCARLLKNGPIVHFIYLTDVLSIDCSRHCLLAEASLFIGRTSKHLWTII